MIQEICLLLLKLTAVYFLSINFLYGILMLLSWMKVKKYRREIKAVTNPEKISPVSFIIPAFNEESLIVETIQTYLALPQDKKEIIVINDGSHDKTFKLLQTMFQLRRKVDDSNIFTSITHPHLIVLEAPHMGKAQALNLGITHAQYELICTMDADTIPTARGVEGCLRAFAQDPKLIAAGGVIQVLKAPGWYTTFQGLEYLRTFLCERLGWSIMGSTTLISGAFCMVKKAAWKKIDGFRPNSITEDFDLIVRLRKAYPGPNNHFRILPITTCYTQVPKDTKHLMVQRMRWQLGLIETLFKNLDLCFHPAHGILGLIAIPYSWLVEVLSPILEFTALAIIPFALFQGWIDYQLVLFYLLAGLVFNVTITLFGIYLDNRYVSRNQNWSCLKSAAQSTIMHFGYKQLTSWWRLLALMKSFKKNQEWGEKPRAEITPQSL
jgi:cellulose synthase/poly-beta-1,6-N-acetylglucosamine synthase-like glycosyltransferase